jgi:hypothetical protein
MNLTLSRLWLGASPSPSGCRANRALVETMDKDAIRAWLR